MTITAKCDVKLACDIRAALQKMKHCSLEYDLVDYGPKDTTSIAGPSRVGGAPCGKGQLVAAIDLICYALDKSGKKYANMQVRSKHPGSRSAFTLKQPLRDYLGELCEIPQYKSCLTGQINSIVSFLETNPKYRGIKSIKVDLNLIEVRLSLLINFALTYVFCFGLTRSNCVDLI